MDKSQLIQAAGDEIIRVIYANGLSCDEAVELLGTIIVALRITKSEESLREFKNKHNITE